MPPRETPLARDIPSAAQTADGSALRDLKGDLVSGEAHVKAQADLKAIADSKQEVDEKLGRANPTPDPDSNTRQIATYFATEMGEMRRQVKVYLRARPK
jgi:hypothetical protein